MSGGSLWEGLSAFSETYTCYSSAVATWVAHDRADWPSAVNPGLALSVLDAGDGLFGFAHFPPGLRTELGLMRVGLDGPGTDALGGVLEELERSGRVIVAGDGFRLPWHVAHGRRHVPHWYVLGGEPDRLEAIDPFACRNELGLQAATCTPIARDELGELLVGLPGGDPVLELRERLALGDECRMPSGACQWFVRGEVADSLEPAGAEGPRGVLALARFFNEHGQDLSAYRQADDIWSIARHRAFLARHAAGVTEGADQGALAEWVRDHGETLAKRWSHMAPLLMQATLALSAGRPASASVPETLEELAGREQAAAHAFPSDLDVGSI
ncbi:MAG TPA: hypothetical protein VGN25_02595 [Solirubrobacteraceae bacterium]|jgi:hypothetical protein|nr:hypothetical protein [Solirubrobacteraceae bacterium]